MQTPQESGAPGRAVWNPSLEVATGIRRAVAAFGSRTGSASTLTRATTPRLRGVRIAICDDSRVFLGGLELALDALGVIVCERAEDLNALEQSVQRGPVEAVIVDIAQPPTFTIEGILAAVRLREARPGLPILLLSSNVAMEAESALSALRADSRSLGFLRKDRLAGGTDLASALARLLDGGTVIDADVVASLVTFAREGTALERLSARERQTLELVAQGLTNSAIARTMFLSPKTVEANIASLFAKLGLPGEPTANRRVLATLTYLRASQTSASDPPVSARSASLPNGAIHEQATMPSMGESHGHTRRT